MVGSKRIPWYLLSPTIVILLIVGLLPFIYVLIVSFYNWNPLGKSDEMTFIAGDNFRKLVFDEDFLLSVWRSIKYAFTTLFFEFIIGFLLALSLRESFPFRPFFRIVHTLPLVVAPIVVGSIFKLFTVSGFGPLPHFLKEWFGYSFNYGRDAEQAFWMIVFMDIWHWTPFVTLTLLAGLSALPKDPYESAKMDGANGIQIFFHITLPMMIPVLLVVVFIRLMDSLKAVDEIWMLTSGGPGVETRLAGIHIWRSVFESRFYGYGSAMSIFLLYITIVICWFLYVVMTSKQNESNA